MSWKRNVASAPVSPAVETPSDKGTMRCASNAMRTDTSIFMRRPSSFNIDTSECDEDAEKDIERGECLGSPFAYKEKKGFQRFSLTWFDGAKKGETSRLVQMGLKGLAWACIVIVTFIATMNQLNRQKNDATLQILNEAHFSLYTGDTSEEVSTQHLVSHIQDSKHGSRLSCFCDTPARVLNKEPEIAADPMAALASTNDVPGTHVKETQLNKHITGIAYVDPWDHLNEEIVHPIHTLIKNANEKWEAKVNGQSKFLEQAVEEYKRRYNRPPPKGFDAWYRFAKENNVVLVDEFDVLMKSLEPFHAVPYEVLIDKAQRLVQRNFTFTIEIKDGEVRAHGTHADTGRARDQLKLYKAWAPLLGKSVNITASAHDGPAIMLDHETRSTLLKAASEKRKVTKAQVDDIRDSAHVLGWGRGCAPESRMRRKQDGLVSDDIPPGSIKFIENHRKAMDLCENPEWHSLHGFTSWRGPNAQAIEPLMSFSKTDVHGDILGVPLEQFYDYEPYDPAWENKHSKIFWRGSTTGVWFDRESLWRQSQRMRLYFSTRDTLGIQRMRFPGSDGYTLLPEADCLNEDLVDTYLDFAFTGTVAQCKEDDGTCDALDESVDFLPTVGWPEANEFKYLLDIDGNAWSGRFHRLLLTNSMVIKSTIFPEWYSDWIEPWVHYAPVQVDYSDLYNVAAFFIGDMEGNNGNDELGRRIAEQGKEFASRFWRIEDMQAYMFRLVLEWARLVEPKMSERDYEP